MIVNMSEQFTQDLNQQRKRLENGHLNNIVSSGQMLQSAVTDKLGDKEKAKNSTKNAS